MAIDTLLLTIEEQSVPGCADHESIEQGLLARSPGAQIQTKVILFHVVIDPNFACLNQIDWGRVLNMISRQTFADDKKVGEAFTFKDARSATC